MTSSEPFAVAGDVVPTLSVLIAALGFIAVLSAIMAPSSATEPPYPPVVASGPAATPSPPDAGVEDELDRLREHLEPLEQRVRSLHAEVERARAKNTRRGR